MPHFLFFCKNDIALAQTVAARFALLAKEAGRADIFVESTNAITKPPMEDFVVLLGDTDSPLIEPTQRYCILPQQEPLDRQLQKLFQKRAAVLAVPMAARHLSAIAALEQGCFAHPWSRETLEAQLTNPTARFFAAERDGEVVGYIGANLILDEMYIANIAVEEQHRHRGAAMVLMRALVMAAQRENAALLTLEVRKSNTHAIAWYRRCGFLDMGIRPNFYTAPDEDALIMTKYLKKDET